jgi:hypothetical protein
MCQDAKRVEPRVLHPTSSRLLDVPDFPFWGMPQCDFDGNLYYHVDQGSMRLSTILKIVPSTSTPVRYQLPPELANSTGFMNFSVTPSGHVYLLNESNQGGYLVLSFGSDGEYSSETRLELPAHVEAQDFAMSDAGIALVSGFFGESAPEKQRGKAFLGLFDSAGRLVRRVNEPLAPVDLQNVHKRPHEGGAALGDDGKLYLLHPTGIVVLSLSGEVEKRIPLDKPEDAGAAAAISVSGGYISIRLLKADPERQLHARYLVIDAHTGKVFRDYITETGMPEHAVCFNRKEGYTFAKNEAGKVKLVFAELR